jgi:hypothetical protein
VDVADLVPAVEQRGCVVSVHSAIVACARHAARSPLLRLAAIGGALVAGHAALQRLPTGAAPTAPPRQPIVVSAERVRLLESGFATRWGRAPTAPERAALIGQTVQDEMLYREARVLALGSADASVRRRLLELMRALGGEPGRSEDELVRDALELGLDDDVVIRRLLAEKMRLVLRQGRDDQPVRDEDLAALLQRDRDRFVRAATVSLQQLFLSSDTRGDDGAARDAGRLLAALRAGKLSAADAVMQTDALPVGSSWRSVSRLQLQGRFGKAFADSVFALDADEWSGPIASPFGLHLVRVEDRQPARVPSLDELRPVLLAALRRERAQVNYARGLERLRSLYEVRIEDAATAGPPAADLASAR